MPTNSLRRKDEVIISDIDFEIRQNIPSYKTAVIKCYLTFVSLLV